MKVEITSHLIGAEKEYAVGSIVETDEAIRLINAGVAIPYVEPETKTTRTKKLATETR